MDPLALTLYRTNKTQHHTRNGETAGHATTTENNVTADKIAALRVELEGIALESAADPPSVAEDLGAWRARESTRQDRIVQIEQRIRDLSTLGLLVDDQAAMNTIREYLSKTAEPRTKLAYIAENRVFKSSGTTPQVRPLLIAWWREIHHLSGALPTHDDAEQYVTEQVTSWFKARDGALIALILQSGGTDVAAPEIEDNVDRLPGLPRGLAYGVHRTVSSSA